MISFEEFYTTIPTSLWIEMIDSEEGINEDRLKECYKKLINNGRLTVNEARDILLNDNWSNIPYGNAIGWCSDISIKEPTIYEHDGEWFKIHKEMGFESPIADLINDLTYTGTLTLNSPITKEQWDILEDVEFDHTDRICFHTKGGKTVWFVKEKSDEN